MKLTQSYKDKLNQLLASYHVHYQNLRMLHWNIKGEKFFELHLKFEELYSDLHLKIDEVAERILTLGSTPGHSFSNYLKIADIKEITSVSNAKDGVTAILKGLITLISIERNIMKMAEEAKDEGTASLMSDYIRFQEKLSWMYNAYLQK